MEELSRRQYTIYLLLSYRDNDKLKLVSPKTHLFLFEVRIGLLNNSDSILLEQRNAGRMFNICQASYSPDNTMWGA